MKGEITETEYHILSSRKTDTEIFLQAGVTQPSLYTSEGMAYHRELEKSIKSRRTSYKTKSSLTLQATFTRKK